MYRLQMKSGVKPDTWKNGNGSGSIDQLKDFCTASRMDYRIIEENGNVVWMDLWPRKGKR